jgi:hypothetical protein
MAVTILSLLSLFIFVFAAWMGFVDISDKNAPENRFKDRLNKLVKWKWFVNKRFVITKIGLIIGLILGTICIFIS